MRIKRPIYLILLYLSFLFYVAEGLAQEQEDHLRLSYRWLQGRSLIYDCHKKHFVCVNENSYVSCVNEGEEDVKNQKKILGCIVIKRFETQTKCIKKQQEVIDRARPVPFCFN